jgi:hypothetical protein
VFYSLLLPLILHVFCISSSSNFLLWHENCFATSQNAHGGCATPGDENAAAASGGGGRIAATPDDETVVAGSDVPGLFGEAVNELMCWAS